MKKNLLLLPLLFCTLTVFAQSLIGENKQWYIGVTPMTQPPFTTIMKMEGDTVVDNKLYKKIYRVFRFLRFSGFGFRFSVY